MSTSPRRRWISLAVRAAAVGLAVGLGMWALARDWPGFTAAAGQIGPVRVAVATALVVTGLLASAEVWRGSVRAVAGPIERGAAQRVFFVTQLGKYIPGSVWTVAAQVEAADRHGVPRLRMAIGALLFIFVHLLTGLLLSGLLLGLSGSVLIVAYWWAFALVPLASAALTPRLLTHIVNLSLKLMRRAPLSKPLRARELAGPLLWMLPTWLLFGAAATVVAAPLVDAPWLQITSTMTGAFAVSWSVGLLVIPAPAGLGAREATLVLALAPVLDVTDVASVAILLRVVHTIADLALGGFGLAASVKPRPRTS